MRTFTPGQSFSCQRHAFSLPDDMHYLNCAYMAPLSRAVEDAAYRALIRQRVPSDLPPACYFDIPNELRTCFAQLIQAPGAEHIAIVPSVSYAMAIAARNLPSSRGQNIVLIGAEFPSAVLAWRRYARIQEVELRMIDAPLEVPLVARGDTWNARLYDAIDCHTSIVVLAPVHWSDGTMFQMDTLAQRAREVGAAVIIDGTQSIGALPFDVQAIQPDLLVTAGYKWLMGGYGLSLTYIGPRLRHAQPLEEVWTSQAGSEDFTRLVEYQDRYRDTAERFDGGQRASFVLAPMLSEAIRQVLCWDPQCIQQYCANLLLPWLPHFEALGIALAPPTQRAAHLFGLTLPHGTDTRHIADQLRQRNVFVSVRGDVLRVAPHVYNTPDDMAAFCEGLSAALAGRRVHATMA